jgi:sortase A
MAYVYMPFLFAVLGYSIIYIITAPSIRLLISAFSINEEMPSEKEKLKTIYNSDVKYREKLSLDRLNQPFIEELQPNSNAAQTFKAENIVNIKDIQYPKLGEHYAMLTCERIQLDVPIYWGDTTKILNAGVGQFMGSFLPGFDRSILLSAHNTTYFKPIERIKVGDIVIYDTNYGEFQYIVDEVSIINVEEAEDMLNHLLALHEEKLIMYTCYPFQSLAGNKEKRMFAFADKLTGPRVVK